MSDNGWKYIDEIWHYFMHGRPLCNEWIMIVPSDKEHKEHKDEDEKNCKKCVKLKNMQRNIK